MDLTNLDYITDLVSWHYSYRSHVIYFYFSEDTAFLDTKMKDMPSWLFRRNWRPFSGIGMGASRVVQQWLWHYVWPRQRNFAPMIFHFIAFWGLVYHVTAKYNHYLVYKKVPHHW